MPEVSLGIYQVVMQMRKEYQSGTVLCHRPGQLVSKQIPGRGIDLCQDRSSVDRQTKATTLPCWARCRTSPLAGICRLSSRCVWVFCSKGLLFQPVKQPRFAAGSLKLLVRAGMVAERARPRHPRTRSLSAWILGCSYLDCAVSRAAE